jgi:hypothetical protein
VVAVGGTSLKLKTNGALLTLIDGMPSEMVAGLACPAGPLGLRPELPRLCSMTLSCCLGSVQ